GEASDFARFNRNQVRQAGHVRQLDVEIDLLSGAQHAAGRLNVSGDLRVDWAALNQLLHGLRETRDALGEDPYLHYNAEPGDSYKHRAGELPTPEQAIKDIVAAGDGLDLVGILASGTVYRAFANHLGQRNWYAADSFNFDWSCFNDADKAVKARYAGARWRAEELQQCMAQLTQLMALMQRPPRTVKAGRYRVYLSPAALYELLSVLGRDGFDLKAHRCRTSPLLKLVQGERELSPSVTLIENNKRGFAPDFTGEGFTKPEQVILIENGAFGTSLNTARSAKEYGVTVNAGTAHPQNLELAAGQLPHDQALNVLGTGLYIGNLWYCNYSDRMDCRITGLTRFATFWVQDGNIVAPVEVMRFDDSLYRILGENLIALTRERELLMDAGTYHCRSTASARLPGAIIDDLRLTL
ncbi:MAG: metallopeptidase TldD-related protein, partial [Gammaproteobacteria bacterium]|nr:metallopeptidase TldD-related protein [Gammaproteobacteria bacterium]